MREQMTIPPIGGLIRTVVDGALGGAAGTATHSLTQGIGGLVNTVGGGLIGSSVSGGLIGKAVDRLLGISGK